MKCPKCGKEMLLFPRRTRSKVQVHFECKQDGCGFKSKYGYGEYVGEAMADARWKTEESRLNATDKKVGSKRNDLKPCPFCGGKAYIADLRYGQFVTCHHKDDCHIRPDSHPFSGAKIEEQIEAWNRRATDA